VEHSFIFSPQKFSTFAKSEIKIKNKLKKEKEKEKPLD
jgi:hypothetical protein